MKKKNNEPKADREPKRLPRKYLPGYAFIPKEGHYDVRKVGLTRDQVKNDPRFYNSRLLAAQFGRAVKFAQALLTACSKPLGIKCKSGQLTGIINRALMADESNIFGSGILMTENLAELIGFEFNETARFEEVCTLPFSINPNTHKGSLSIEVPAFVPAYYLKPPANVSHARIWLMSAILDPIVFTGTLTAAKTTCFPIKRLQVSACSLSIPPKTEGHLVQVIALGIQWYGYVNGQSRLKESVAPGSLTVIDVH
ncbi:hypothetical protein [Paraflavitalea sp. CAU 1676]|uniref:hypothetical protein n=1 Tax=Paraflavitalea sp. CAU 1676 TaxID=3032598 RepID=UPI0023D9E430|nr:hypothetical protein [Paraflavitalea sp. CAU 1676]MDF2192363.1 hypothetical protein [Paraflavitalea sp. CAU 1676]